MINKSMNNLKPVTPTKQVETNTPTSNQNASTVASPSSNGGSNVGTPAATPSKNKKQEEKRLHKIEWTPSTDALLATWADEALCYKWLHETAYRKYHHINYAFSIPIIVLSTLTGTLNVGLTGYVPLEYQAWAQAGIGGISIFAAMLTTLQNFFRPSNLSESHHIASVGWAKIHRNISIELRIDPEFRKEPDSFYKTCRADYDRMMESQPVIPKDVIKKFKSKFEKIRDLHVPDVCDRLSPTTIFNRDLSSIPPSEQEQHYQTNALVSSAVQALHNSNTPYGLETILEEDHLEPTIEFKQTLLQQKEQQLKEKEDELNNVLQQARNGNKVQQVYTSEGVKYRVSTSHAEEPKPLASLFPVQPTRRPSHLQAEVAKDLLHLQNQHKVTDMIRRFTTVDKEGTTESNTKVESTKVAKVEETKQEQKTPETQEEKSFVLANIVHDDVDATSTTPKHVVIDINSSKNEGKNEDKNDGKNDGAVTEDSSLDDDEIDHIHFLPQSTHKKQDAKQEDTKEENQIKAKRLVPFGGGSLIGSVGILNRARTSPSSFAPLTPTSNESRSQMGSNEP